MKLRELIGDRKFYKDVVVFGVPVALQNLLTSSMSFVDSMMIGGKSEIALGAIGIAAQWANLLTLCCWGIHSAGTMFFAQYWGAKDKDGISKAAWVMFMSVLAVTVPAALFTILFPDLIMKIYTNDAEMIAIGQGYLRIAGVSFIFSTISVGCSGLLRSVGNAKLPLFASIAGVVTNTFLNWVLIYGKFGFPDMGAEGAAVATAISSFLNMGILIAVALIKKNIVYEAMRKKPKLEKGFIKEYYQKATPIILNEAIYGFAALVINMVFGRQGGKNMSAITIFRTLEGLIMAFYWGFVNALSVMIGNSIGAGKIKDGIVYSRRFTLMNFATTVIVTGIVFIFKAPIISLFGVGAEISAIAADLLIVMLLLMPLRTCNYMLIGVYRAGGESKFGFYVEVIAIWFVSVPLVLLTGLVWNLPFVWVFAMSYSEDVAKIAVQIWYMISNKWIKPVTELGRQGYEEYKKLVKSEK